MEAQLPSLFHRDIPDQEDELVTIGCLHLPIISLELVQGGLQSCNGILVGTSTVQLFLF